MSLSDDICRNPLM